MRCWDVGSSKTVCLIGRAEPGILRVIGAALRETQGVRAGTVIGMEHAEESIRDAVAAAEKPRRHPHPERHHLGQFAARRSASPRAPRWRWTANW
ncbi:MAG: hypothetical protein WDN08_13870 [Rhizomicrobium sp.]